MRKIINVILIMVLLALVLVLLAIGAETNRPSTKNPTGRIDIRLSKEEIPKLVEIIRIWKLVDELELEEEQLVKFLLWFKESNDLRARHYRSRRDAVAKLRELLEADSSEDRLKSAMDELKSIETKFHQKEKQLENTLNSILTVKQQAKYTVFRDVYKRDMQRLMRNLQELSNLREQPPKPQSTPLRRNREG